VKTTALALIILLLAVGCVTGVHTTNTVTGDGLWGEIYRLGPTNKILGPVDGAYESFTYEEWFRWIPRSIVPTRTNAWDCDDYALEAMIETRKKFRTTGKSESTPAIGVVVGKIEKTGFLGMQGKGLHAVNIIHVKNHGWMFYEPQTHRTAKVSAVLQEKMFTIHWVLF